jgi:hypothetical protein
MKIFAPDIAAVCGHCSIEPPAEVKEYLEKQNPAALKCEAAE